MKTIAFGILFSLIMTTMVFVSPVSAQTGIHVPSMSQCDTLAQNFINNWNVSGMTLAISYQGRLIYSRGFGTNDTAGTIPTNPHTIMRVASISKSLAAVGIMKLVEDGEIALGDTVFGPNGIFSDNVYFTSANIIDERVKDITVQQFLEHTSGWDESIHVTPTPLPPYPWGFPYSDPGSFPLHATMTLGEPNPVTRRALIKWRLQRALDFAPGTRYQYSNTGFAVLAQIIEEVTGRPYQEYMQENIFEPMGIFDIQPGKSLPENRFVRETQYSGIYTTLSATGNGLTVPWYDGGFWVEAMDGYGGMTATSRDLVRFLNGVDGFNTRPDILNSKTMQTMLTASTTNAAYAKGWGVGSTGWWHTGQFDGTASIFERRSSQVNYATIINEVPTGNFRPAMNPLALQCINAATSIPSHDLFHVPETAASGLIVTSSNSNSISLSWTPGNGDGRVIIMRKNGEPNRFPAEGTDYTGSEDLGGGNSVVYSGSGNTATITGLDQESTYNFRIYEFNKSKTTGNHALYQLGRYAETTGNTTGATFQTTISGRVTLPNGRGIPKVRLELFDQKNNKIAVALTSPFGDYTLIGVPTGSGYILRANERRYSFSAVDLNVTGPLANVDLVAEVPVSLTRTMK